MSEQNTNEQNINNFPFFPRPEAHAMGWYDLLPPIKRAVCDLLIRLDGAEQIEDEAEVANCFLVYGSRGTGKTTVLLSAQEAIHKQNGYFNPIPKDDKQSKKSEPEKKRARKERRENMEGPGREIGEKH